MGAGARAYHNLLPQGYLISVGFKRIVSYQGGQVRVIRELICVVQGMDCGRDVAEAQGKN